IPCFLMDPTLASAFSPTHPLHTLSVSSVDERRMEEEALAERAIPYIRNVYNESRALFSKWTGPWRHLWVADPIHNETTVFRKWMGLATLSFLALSSLYAHFIDPLLQHDPLRSLVMVTTISAAVAAVVDDRIEAHYKGQLGYDLVRIRTVFNLFIK